VDTGYLFEETLKTKQKIETAFRVRILTYRPSFGQEAQTRQNAWPDLMTHRPDGCCALRKIEPMQRAMAELQPLAVLNARARFQCRTRRSLPIVEWDQMPLRINPLVDWSLDRIRAYVAKNQVPYNPLHDAGYPSIGCWPCTQPVQAGDDFRSGRWTGTAKIECGLWTRKPTSRDRQPLGQITTLEVAAD
jgi:phosphoadenosine phosphosulfate reductase